jgi:hypothetical protein
MVWVLLEQRDYLLTLKGKFLGVNRSSLCVSIPLEASGMGTAEGRQGYAWTGASSVAGSATSMATGQGLVTRSLGLE